MADPIRRAARTVTAPVRGYFNGHFEALKDEVREAAVSAPASSDVTAAWDRLAELENLLAEQSVHQARAIAQLSDAVTDCADRICDLERVVRQLAAVVAPPEPDADS